MTKKRIIILNFAIVLILMVVLFLRGGTFYVENRIVVSSNSIVLQTKISGNSLDILYSYYSSLQRYPTMDYVAYVMERNDDEYLSTIVDGKTLSEIFDFVCDIPYKSEEEEYPKFPIETLVDNCGDCEDKAILLASLLYLADYDVSLIRLPSHMATGLKTTINLFSDPYVDGYYYVDATNMYMGKVPDKYVGETNMTVYPVCDRPILYHEWNDISNYPYVFRLNGESYLRGNITVVNIGNEYAESVRLDIIADNTISITFSLRPYGVKVIDFTLDCFSGYLETQLFLDGVLVDGNVNMEDI